MTERTQQEVVTFLLNPANWPEKPARIVHLETHISHVFLGGALALKMKKAMKLPYLDFSTLALRERYCRCELEINRRFSRKIYLGLSRVARRDDGRLALDPADGKGKTVEWLVRMRRFADADILANRFARERPGAPLCARLAAMACRAHRAADVRRESDFPATLDTVLRQIESALLPRRQIAEAVAVADVLHALASRLRAWRAPLRQRAAQVYVRRCHGDMHLGNIVLWEGEPQLFDAIEFDETLATIDILYDLAFLLMDLKHRGLKAAANMVMNGWLARCDDVNNHAAVAALAPMMALRALIRAMVLADLADQQEGERRQRDFAQATDYVSTAARCLKPSAPFLIAVGGLSGSGKTTLARALAARLAPAAGMVHLRSDVERKVMAGVDEFARLSPEAYTPAASERVYARLFERANAALSSPWPVIVDAVFAKEDERAAIAQVARERGTPFFGLWLEAPAEVLRARVAARADDASDADVAVLEKQLAYDPGAITWRRVKAEGSPEAVLARALAALGDLAQPS